MTTLSTGLSRFAVAACAIAITAVSGWAFVDGTASIDRDPFHFASTMAANAKVRVAQTESRTASNCTNKSGIPGRLPAPVCLNG